MRVCVCVCTCASMCAFICSARVCVRVYDGEIERGQSFETISN